MSAVQFEFNGVFDLSLEECFPDGVPENVTIADIVEAAQASGSLTNFMGEWVLFPNVAVYFDGDVRHCW